MFPKAGMNWIWWRAFGGSNRMALRIHLGVTDVCVGW